jgi:hypothetical protein
MPRPKQYEDDAARAAAWRLRQERERLQAAEIARHAERLHQLMKKAAAGGDTEAAALIGATVAETLKNLQRRFQKPPQS